MDSKSSQVVKGKITIFDASTGDNIRSWDAHAGNGVYSLSLSPSGTLLASSSWNDKVVYLWNVDFAQHVAEHQHPDNIRCIAFSPTGTSIGTASNDIWELPQSLSTIASPVTRS